jgi:hypothetical protein
MSRSPLYERVESVLAGDLGVLRFFYHTTLKRPWVVEDDIPAGRQAKKLPAVLSQGRAWTDPIGV